jgi:hypothetical protein
MDARAGQDGVNYQRVREGVVIACRAAADLAVESMFPADKPVPDMLGLLADLQFRREDAEHLQRQVAEHWPEVVSIRCGILHDRSLLTICLSTCSAAQRAAHLPLEQWLRETFPQLAPLAISWLGPLAWDAWGRTTLLYPRVQVPEAVRLSRSRSGQS